MPQIPSNYESMRSTHIHFETTGKTPNLKKFHQIGHHKFQYSVLRNPQNVGTRFGHFKSRHTQAEYKRKPTTGSQTSLDTIYLKQL